MRGMCRPMWRCMVTEAIRSRMVWVITGVLALLVLLALPAKAESADYETTLDRLGRLQALAATCKPVEVVTPILKEQGLFDYFDRIGGASMDESVDNKTDVIRLVLQDPRLAGKRILMVGDRQDDMQGAVNNQLPAAAVLYGYGSREEMEPWNPVLLAQNCEELTQYILG